MARWILLAGTLAALTGVLLGAFGAHGLRSVVTPERLAVFQTGVQYQLIHALALVALGIWLRQLPATPLLHAAGLALLVGMVLFSGSLYALVVLDMPKLGLITPIGGTAFIVGWGLFAAAVWRLAE